MDWNVRIMIENWKTLLTRKFCLNTQRTIVQFLIWNRNSNPFIYSRILLSVTIKYETIFQMRIYDYRVLNA